MSDLPRDWIIFTIRFVCAGGFFGFVVALVGLRFFESINPTSIGAWLVITLLLSLYAAWIGDEAWGRLIGFFRWW